MCLTRSGCAEAIVTVVVVADVIIIIVVVAVIIIIVVVVVVHFRFVSMSFRLKYLTLDIPQKCIWKYYCNCMLIQIRNFMHTIFVVVVVIAAFFFGLSRADSQSFTRGN